MLKKDNSNTPEGIIVDLLYCREGGEAAVQGILGVWGIYCFKDKCETD